MDKTEDLETGREYRREELQRSMGRVESKVDQVLAGLSAHVKDDNTHFDHLDKRVSGLEKKVYWASGIGALAVFLISNFKSWLLPS